MKVLSYESIVEIPQGTDPKYTLAFTNLEVRMMFRNMIHNWFMEAEGDYQGITFRGHQSDECIHEPGGSERVQLFRYGETSFRSRTGTILPWVCARAYRGFAFEGKKVLIG